MNLDALFAQSRRAPRLAGRGLIKVYRYTLSPLVGFHCRHLPTCSEYGDEALDRYGLWVGSWMTLARLLRCQPWGTSGIDRVPERAPQGAALVHAVALRSLALTRPNALVFALLHRLDLRFRADASRVLRLECLRDRGERLGVAARMSVC